MLKPARSSGRLAAILAVLGCANATAADNFSFVGSQTSSFSSFGQTVSFEAGFATFNSLFAGLSLSGLSSTWGQYNPGLPVSFTINLRGLPASASFPNQGATGTGALLNFSMPGLGINQSFQGADRDASIQLLKDFLSNGSNAGRIQRGYVRASPFDPLAGNPASLEASMVARDFAPVFNAFSSNEVEGRPQQTVLAMAPGPVSDLAQAGMSGILGGPQSFRPMPGLGAQYGNFHEQGLTAQTVTIPLSLTFRSDLDPRRQLSLNMPIGLNNIQGATGYSVGLGGSLRYPMATRWALVGSLGYGMTASPDLGSAGQMASASVASSYLIRTEPVDLIIGNMIGYYRAIATTLGGISADPRIGNTAFRNGVLVSRKTDWIGGGLSLEGSLVNTYYAGTPLYSNNYTEVRVGLGSNRRADSVRGYVQGGASYLFSSRTRGFGVDLGWWF